MFPNIDVNWLAVVVAAVVSMIVGSFWYSPLMFGNAWMKLLGMTKKDIEKAKKKGMGKTYLIAFVLSLIMAYVLAHFVAIVGGTHFFDGVTVGFWVWLGFVATIAAGSILWEGKAVKLFWINSLYWLVVLVLEAGILAVWQ